jgi:CheY-like chemotaxis protein
MSNFVIPYRLLVVEDNEHELNLFQEAIRQLQLEITILAITNATEALDLLAQDNQFHLILANLNCPEINGIKFCTSLAATPARQIPVVLMSNVPKHLLPARISAPIAVSYIEKPEEGETFQAFTQKIYAKLCGESKRFKR